MKKNILIVFLMASLLTVLAVMTMGQKNDSTFMQPSTFQNKIEKKYEDDISKVLLAIVGQKNFKVAVQTQLFDKETIQETTRLIPKKVEEINRKTMNRNLKSVKKNKIKKETLVPQQETVNPMPGFPTLIKKELKDPHFPVVSTQEGDKQDENSFQSLESQTRYFYNSQTNKWVIPANKVKKITISVLLNQTQLDVLSMTKGQVQNILSDYLNINDQSDIEINLMAIPFKNSFLDFSDAAMTLEKFFRSKGWPTWVLPLGLLMMLIMMGLSWGIYKTYQFLKNKKTVDELKSNLEQSQVKEKNKVNYKQKSQELTDIAKTKPKLIASCIENMAGNYATG